MIILEKDQELRKKLIEAGFNQAAKFSWNAMAQSVLDIYREIGNKK
jgi:glycosyltransferase involved in cell wall biosynthesis